MDSGICSHTQENCVASSTDCCLSPPQTRLHDMQPCSGQYDVAWRHSLRCATCVHCATWLWASFLAVWPTPCCCVVVLCRTGQYALFMTRYGDAQRMAPYLMDALLPRIRAGESGPRLARSRESGCRLCPNAQGSVMHSSSSSKLPICWGFAEPGPVQLAALPVGVRQGTGTSSLHGRVVELYCMQVMQLLTSPSARDRPCLNHVLVFLCGVLCAAGLSAMLTAYHPCRVPVTWAAQQLGFDTDQPDEVRDASPNQGNCT